MGVLFAFPVIQPKGFNTIEEFSFGCIKIHPRHDPNHLMSEFPGKPGLSHWCSKVLLNSHKCKLRSPDVMYSC
eukprot:scaffold137360_cov13-Tisochrysis_lutea.AAC.1